MKMLKAKLYLIKQQENLEKISDIRGEVTDNGWGSQIRSYVLQPYTMVKDHRTSQEIGNAQAVLDGDLDPFVNAVLLDNSANGSGLYEYHNYDTTDSPKSLIKYPTYVFCRYTVDDFNTFKKQLRFSITYKLLVWARDANYEIDLNIYNFGLIYCDKFKSNGAVKNVASFYFVEPYLDYKTSDPNLGEGFYLKEDYSNILF
jgi:hypothetical protein